MIDFFVMTCRQLKRDLEDWVGRLAVYLTNFNKWASLCIVVKRNSDVRQAVLEGSNIIHQNVDIRRSSVGFGSYVGWNSNLINCKIGRYCSIGPHVNIVLGRHPTKYFVSTHPAFFSTMKQSGFTYIDNQCFEEYYHFPDGKSVHIGNDVWIGSYVIIIEGVTVGDGAIIGAGSVVTKDVPPYAIASGNPARIIKTRFTDQQIYRLQMTQWWSLPSEVIKSFHNSYKFVDNFIALIEKYKLENSI